MPDDPTNDEHVKAYELEYAGFDADQVIQASQENPRALKEHNAIKGGNESRNTLIQQGIALLKQGEKFKLTMEQLEGAQGGSESAFSERTTMEQWLANLSMEDNVTQKSSDLPGSSLIQRKPSVESYDGSWFVK